MNDFFIAQNLYKKFSNIEIDFSLSAKKNSMTAIIGKSGSGKSTILRLIAGLEICDKKNQSSSSENKTLIKLSGKDITNVPPQKRNIGMVFQNHTLFQNMNVIQNVSYGLLCKGVDKKSAYEKSKQLLSRFGLDGFENRKVETLSGGESQRVSLARTLVTKPSLILFDEPLSSLDSNLRKNLACDIKMSQEREGFTGIFVTHDIDEALSLADTIVEISSGKKIWEGSAKEFRIR
ncbi:MAG: ABC transporter ATP-binding protein [Treponema sp.]|nr:ABC transporter ATP-binding protein [Treponema sp.]